MNALYHNPFFFAEAAEIYPRALLCKDDKPLNGSGFELDHSLYLLNRMKSGLNCNPFVTLKY